MTGCTLKKRRQKKTKQLAIVKYPAQIARISHTPTRNVRVEGSATTKHVGKSFALATFHAETSKLKASALPNFARKFVTLLIFQAETSELKASQLAKHSPHVRRTGSIPGRHVQAEETAKMKHAVKVGTIRHVPIR